MGHFIAQEIHGRFADQLGGNVFFIIIGDRFFIKERIAGGNGLVDRFQQVVKTLFVKGGDLQDVLGRIQSHCGLTGFFQFCFVHQVYLGKNNVDGWQAADGS
ncbi:hypothetical protein SDC9_80462 [bioreactor metagenome]|uniref:Uncharacterized protein n=1 Tax=bioreactor metagenome TaxID=1076179 RepID=A0A644Z1J8_9ZZZZ